MVMDPRKRRAREQARAWFRGLSGAERTKLRKVQARDEVVVAAYVEPGSTPEDEDAESLYDYLVGHELFEVVRTFHICTAEPEARDAITRRHLPTTFVCPRANERCPMRVLLAECPGRDVRFFVGGARV